LETCKICVKEISQPSKELTLEKQCYAVIWAVAYFWYYLESIEFEVITDNYALKWLQTSLG